MRKIFTIAMREYRAMVGTKAFILSIVMMPILFMGSLMAMEIMERVSSVKELKIAVIDETGEIYDDLNTNLNLANNISISITDGTQDDSEDLQDSNDPGEDGPDEAEENRSFPGMGRELYQLERIEGPMSDDLRVELSNRIKEQDLYAFLEIPKQALEQNIKVGKDGFELDENKMMRFYAQDSSLSQARRVISSLINKRVREIRLSEANIDLMLVQQASVDVHILGKGLVEIDADGNIVSGEERDALTALFLPMGVMMMMFMVIFMAAQPTLESVLEEKSQRIAEVLLGSANPFQLMLGKLLGTVGGSLTVFSIYLVGMLGLAMNRGWTDQIPFELVPWFVVFQVVGVLFYAAIFMAIGASVSQLKEAQAMLLPVWMMLMAPMFVWFVLVREPNGTMATYFSLFPPVTPTAMMLRMATGQSIPIWQPALGLVLTVIATLVIVVLAARIFRVGILWQGKTPKMTEILKWAVLGS